MCVSIRQVLAVFGVPQTLFCNLGRQFTRQLIQALAQHWDGDLAMEVGMQRVHNPALDVGTARLEEMIAEHVLQKPNWTQWLPSVQCEVS